MTARPTMTVAPASVTILGSISDPSGYPLAGVTVLLFENASDQSHVLDTATTDDIGEYRFMRVHAGLGDELRVAATDASGAHVPTHAILTIGPDLASTHHMTMPVAGYVQGEVSKGRGTDPSRRGGDVYVTAIGETTVQAVCVSAMGRYRIGGLAPGEYALVFEDSDLRFADSAHSADATVHAGRATTIAHQVLGQRNAQRRGNSSDS